MDATNESLEANCRKLKDLYGDELLHVSQHGRFNMKASQQGSRLFTVVSLMSELLNGDTQLVESINSIIRLIGDRCPSIDLETMSARIITKKALTPATTETSASGRRSLSKRWSSFSTRAKPLLMELTMAGMAYKQIMEDAQRFTQPARATMPALEGSLHNTDISKALPDVRRTPQKQWVSAQVKRLKASIEAARRESGRLKSYAPLMPACFTVFCIRRAADHQDRTLYVQLMSYRSLLFVVRLQSHADGSLRWPNGPGTVPWKIQ